MEVINIMYLLIRVVILLMLFAPVFIVFLNKKLRNHIIEKLKYYDSKKIKRVLWSLVIVFAILILAIFYPFESSFIRFDTVEQSVNYSMYGFDILERLNSEIYIAECDDTVFVINEYGNTYRYTSIAKYDEGYGYCGHNIKVKLSTQPTFISTGKFEGAVSVSTIYNKNTNKTCYILSFLDAEFDDDILEIYHQSGERLNTFSNNDGNTLQNYYYIEKGVANKEFSFTLDGQQFNLVL